jgi:hypothetical protein
MLFFLFEISRILVAISLVAAHFYHGKYRHGLSKAGKSILDFAYIDTLKTDNAELYKIKNIRDSLIWITILFLILSIIFYFSDHS